MHVRVVGFVDQALRWTSDGQVGRLNKELVDEVTAFGLPHKDPLMRPTYIETVNTLCGSKIFISPQKLANPEAGSPPKASFWMA